MCLFPHHPLNPRKGAGMDDRAVGWLVRVWSHILPQNVEQEELSIHLEHNRSDNLIHLYRKYLQNKKKDLFFSKGTGSIGIRFDYWPHKQIYIKMLNELTTVQRPHPVTSYRTMFV